MFPKLRRSPIVAATTLALVSASPALVRAQPITGPTPSTATPAGCVSGYPNGTFQGDRPVTRNEFAASMNTCLDRVQRLLPFNKADYATRADLAVLMQRQRELNHQLRDLSDRVGNVSGDTTPTEAH